MPVSPPNRRFHYSNLGIALLDARSRARRGDDRHAALV